MFMLSCASAIVSIHLIRCVLRHVVCIFFLCFFKFLVFVAAIYANKDVYISLHMNADALK